MDEKFILMGLNDDRAKYLSDVLGNKTAKKILDLLAEEKLSESDISKKLNIPLNTVGYNIQKLINAGIIEKSKDFFWSVKGKKIPTYKIINKYIIISPKGSLLGKLKGILPVFAITGLSALLIRVLTLPKSLTERVSDIIPESAKLADSAYSGSSSIVSGIEQNITSGNVSASFFINLHSWEWFLIGAWFAIVIFLILNMRKRT